MNASQTEVWTITPSRNYVEQHEWLGHEYYLATAIEHARNHSGLSLVTIEYLLHHLDFITAHVRFCDEPQKLSDARHELTVALKVAVCRLIDRCGKEAKLSDLIVKRDTP